MDDNKKDTKGVIDDAAKAASDWISKPDNQKQVGGWIAQGMAWLMKLIGKTGSK